jgi:hypothetical protein
MKLGDATGAQGMAAMNEDSRNALTNIILKPTELADVKPS